jgi:hypothetical protein
MIIDIATIIIESAEAQHERRGSLREPACPIKSVPTIVSVDTTMMREAAVMRQQLSPDSLN